MAGKDGSLNFDTKIDSSGFQNGLNSIGGLAKKGFAVTGKVLGAAATGITKLGGAAIKVGSDFPAIGVSPNFSIAQKSLADSNNYYCCPIKLK